MVWKRYGAKYRVREGGRERKEEGVGTAGLTNGLGEAQG